MGQPKFLVSGRSVVKFGGLALPNGQGTLANIDLNDGVNTKLLVGLGIPGDNRQISLAQLLYQGRGAYLADDWGPLDSISVPLIYQEDATHFLGGFLAQLAMAGEQQLTFDNATYIPVKFKGLSAREETWPYDPRIWKIALEFVAVTQPWFVDISATSLSPVTLTNDAGQTVNVTYAGSVWCEPVWTYTHVATDTHAINSMSITNTMSGEALTINFLSVAALPASALRTVTIDCAAQRVTDSAGNEYDVTGSFPKLYGPAGTVNPHNVVVTPASGATAGCTIAETHSARWLI